MDATFDQLARETNAPRRKRGAQPGNKNALTHGFYSKTFAPAEDRDIDAIRQISLDSEIDMLRVSIRRIFELTAGVSDPLQAVRYVHVLTRAVTSLDHLVIRQHALHNTRTDLDDSLREALDELNDKGGVRAADLRKRYAIQKAILETRLDKYVPPPPGTPPPPDPRTLPQPDRNFDFIDPFSRHYKENDALTKWMQAYGEETPLARYWQPGPIPGGYNSRLDDCFDNYTCEMLGLSPSGGLSAGEDEEEDEEEYAGEEWDDDDRDFEQDE
jgi:hypothetical protein